ncbi:MAG TPA: GTP-binding protein, partial [Marinilabiliaceae bacterium]|nr:GTP-binding protein [Marinilabiliaceae bacterium]
IGGVTFRFIDTAGIRTTSDKIESMGIQLTYNKIAQAAIVMLLVDINDSQDKIKEAINDVQSKMDVEKQQLIVVVNKIDLSENKDVANQFNASHYPELFENSSIVALSAKKRINLDELTTQLLKTINLSAINSDEVIVTNARHHEALTHALEGIVRVKEGLESEISGDFLAQDIREVLHYLGSITGQISTDEVLGNIFKNFCIGK